MTSTMRAAAISGGFDPDALLMQAAMVAAGSSIVRSQLSAISAYFAGLKANSLWSKMNLIAPFAGATLAAGLIAYVPGTGPITLGNPVPFVAGDFTSAGLAGNGTTKYLTTGIIPNSASWGASCYLETSLTAGSGRTLMGCQGASGTSIHRIGYINTSGPLAVVSSTVANGATYAENPMGVGFYTGTRLGLSDLRLYKSGAEVNQNVTTATYASPGVELYILANNNNGTANSFTSATTSLMQAHVGLLGSEAATLAALVATLRTGLGRP